jgi:hypothetical protein
LIPLRGPRADYEGETYYFCSEPCAQRFRADPEAFSRDDHRGDGRTRASAAPAPRADEVVQYTCPMHPEIRRPGPSACPICGMALEPVMVAAEAGPSAELVDNGIRARGS